MKLLSNMSRLTGLTALGVSLCLSAAQAATIKIMPLGDSNTQEPKYRSPLSQKLKDEGFDFTTVGSKSDNTTQTLINNNATKHEGWGGYKIKKVPNGTGYNEGIDDHIAEYLGPNGNPNPDVILLMIGTNDIAAYYEMSTMKDRLDALITKISDKTTGLAPNSHLIVATIPPVDPRYDNGNNNAYLNQNVVAYNNAIKDSSSSGIVKKHQLKGELVTWVDVHAALSVGSTDFSDGLHFTDAGGAKVAEVFFQGIKSIYGTNLVSNASFDAEAFDTQTPSGWSEWNNANASYTESYGGARSGVRHGTHWRSSAAEVSTYQYKTGLTNGLYTMRAWVKGNGTISTGEYAGMYVKNYGGSQRWLDIPRRDTYTLIQIRDINVTNGTAELGFYSKVGAYDWIYFDDVEFFKQ